MLHTILCKSLTSAAIALYSAKHTQTTPSVGSMPKNRRRNSLVDGAVVLDVVLILNCGRWSKCCECEWGSRETNVKKGAEEVRESMSHDWLPRIDYNQLTKNSANLQFCDNQPVSTWLDSGSDAARLPLRPPYAHWAPQRPQYILAIYIVYCIVRYVLNNTIYCYLWPGMDKTGFFFLDNRVLSFIQ